MNHIQPYQYIGIKRNAERLINVYRSVNDMKTIQTFQAITNDNINSLLSERLQPVDDFVKVMMNVKISRAQMDKMLLGLKRYVDPFEQPSSKAVEQLFKKVKKLKQPDFAQYDLKESTYIGWNDPGQQKKYMVMYHEGKLIGVHGELSPAVTKGICPICKMESNVSMFMATTKAKGDGTYTKNGNYICHDSERCNKQLSDLTGLYEFLISVKAI